jgi:glycine/serine hydroxymethyltransferase
MGADEMRRISQWILRALRAPGDAAVVESTRREVAELAEQFPVPAARLEQGLEQATVAG